MHLRPPERLGVNVFAHDLAYHARAGQEHRGALGHHDEVGERGEYASAAGAAMNGTTASGWKLTAKLGTQDTKVLQQAQAEEEPSVTVMLLASPGNTRTVEEPLAAAGGSVGEVQRKLGYVRRQCRPEACRSWPRRRR